MFDLEDTAGIMRCILWPEQFANFGELVQPDAMLVVLGVIDKRPGSEEANLIVNELLPLDEFPARFTRGIRVRLGEVAHGQRPGTALRNPSRLSRPLRGSFGP